MEKTLPRMFRETAKKYPELTAQMSRISEGVWDSISYKNAFEISKNFAGGLLSVGIKRGDHIGMISDNRKEWQQIDMGLLSIGAIDVPRGCDATIGDLEYILSFAKTQTVIVENKSQISKILGIKDKLPLLKTFISIEDQDEKVFEECKNSGITLFTFNQIVEKGEEFNQKNPATVDEEINKGQWDDLASIIFTSGTTGQPKGVMLTHGNFLSQLEDIDERIWLNPGDRGILVLPVWHAFERSVEYVVFSQAATLCYSKPIGQILLQDFKSLDPQVLPAVPRVIEAIYDGIYKKMRKTGGITLKVFNFFVTVALFHSKLDRVLFDRTTRYGIDKRWLQWPAFVIPWLLLYPIKLLGGAIVFRKIRAMLGKHFRGAVAGGGALPPAIDKFFWAIGVPLVEGYGLTETSPIISVRPFNRPVLGNVGRPIRELAAKVVDPATGKEVPRGKKGVLLVKGPTVMKGYYERPDLTKEVIDENGWFNTGDLARLTANGEIVLCGRIKDTIVQLGGENIEPVPIEMKIQESRYIKTAVVVGQDQRYLAALIVPEKSEIEQFAQEAKISYKKYEDLAKSLEIKRLLESEISQRVNSKNGFKMFERINKIAVLPKEFEVGVELSAKQEISRYKINAIYASEIKKLFKD